MRWLVQVSSVESQEKHGIATHLQNTDPSLCAGQRLSCDVFSALVSTVRFVAQIWLYTPLNAGEAFIILSDININFSHKCGSSFQVLSITVELLL